MAVPTAITDLSATAASNSPASSESILPNLDDYIRALSAFIRQGYTKAADVASASTTDIGAAAGWIVDVTGTTTITGFGTVAAGVSRLVRFTGALTLTYNATSLILPGSANITTASGDWLLAVSLGSGNWVVAFYQYRTGAATKDYVDTGLSGKADAAHTHAWSAITGRMYGDGTDTGDPNTTTEPFMITNHANGPLGAGTYFYIWTGWHGTDYIAQVAVEAASGAPRTYTRSKTGGTWYAWVRCDLGEGLTRSIGASGYAKIPGAGGLMIQWGSISHGGGGNVAVSFPIAFPNAAVAVVPNSVYNGGANNPSAHSKSASGFTCYWTGGVTITIDYIAIGY